MATFRATVTIEIDRANGDRTTITETVANSGGDNPRFEGRESRDIIRAATDSVLDRLPDADMEAVVRR